LFIVGGRGKTTPAKALAHFDAVAKAHRQQEGQASLWTESCTPQAIPFYAVTKPGAFNASDENLRKYGMYKVPGCQLTEKLAGLPLVFIWLDARQLAAKAQIVNP
jgi:hypothetical protein